MKDFITSPLAVCFGVALIIATMFGFAYYSAKQIQQTKLSCYSILNNKLASEIENICGKL